MARKVETHRFNGTKYRIEVDDPFLGLCDKPEGPKKDRYPALRLSKGLPHGNEKGARTGLITLMHEMIHASNWNLSEEIVDRMAVDMGGLLWRLRYRRRK